MRTILSGLACAFLCAASTIPPLSFEDLAGQSDQIVSGHVGKTWTSWDANHRLIWTRWEIRVDHTLKGAPEPVVVVSEPGGRLDGRGMFVDGAVRYEAGQHVLLFLKRFPSGDKRTVGWAQGKFAIDNQGRVHPEAAPALPASRAGSTPLHALDGLTEDEVRTRLQSRMNGGTR